MAHDTFGLIGSIVDGQLRVDQVIGEGGFSVVYKGEHLGLSEPVAIKCLKLPQQLPDTLADAFSKRFRDESRLAYRLSQGNLHIVRSITSGTTVVPATGALLPYMALEWLDGKSLAQVFSEDRGKKLTVDEAVALFEPAVQAMEYAHSQGIIHRDIKPGNLFLAQTREGLRLKVLDFGLAKILHVDTPLGVVASVKTVNHVLMCSPSYGAPEQFDPGLGPIGPWTDVYAFALVFVEALAGKKARPADNLAQAALRVLAAKGTLPTPRTLGVEVGDALEAVIAQALAMNPAQRPASAGEFWKLLRDAMLVSEPGDAMVPTLREDMLPRMARVLVEPGEVEPAPATAPAGHEPTRASASTAPSDAPSAAPPAASDDDEPPSTTLRMQQAPALPWEIVRAMEQATQKKSTVPPPDPSGSGPQMPLADTMLAPGTTSSGALPYAGPSGPVLPMGAPPPQPTVPPGSAAPSRVPIVVGMIAFGVFVLSALAFVLAYVYRSRMH